jgi:hypothetical protein
VQGNPDSASRSSPVSTPDGNRDPAPAQHQLLDCDVDGTPDPRFQAVSHGRAGLDGRTWDRTVRLRVGTHGSDRQQPAKVSFFQGFRSDKGGRERQQTAAAEGISEAEVSPMFHPRFHPEPDPSRDESGLLGVGLESGIWIVAGRIRTRDVRRDRPGTPILSET